MLDDVGRCRIYAVFCWKQVLFVGNRLFELRPTNPTGVFSPPSRCFYLCT
ncbi:TPA_asm: hypothetical protein [Porphyromonas phage phage029a_Kyudai3]|uniref:Uncharacterized protein n=1 Tax=Porphyromonas phage phage029a_Kyudai3 TaxID=3154119 RepID=A0AAT9JEM1_9CAUD